MRTAGVTSRKKLKLRPQVPTEGHEQEALMDWAQAASYRFPELRLLYAVPNGIPIHGPQKFAIIAAFKRRGLKAGVPDLCLPVQRIYEGNRYAGLYIELKRVSGGVPSPEQDWWLDALGRQGYLTAVCQGCKPAAELLVAYLLGGSVDWILHR